jgi:osmotically inducible protein OsmC
MTKNTARAQWNGDLPKGNGTVELGHGAFKGQYSFHSRFEDGTGTNPEELVAAAHAACFSMAFSHQLATAGFTPTSVKTEATVTLTKGDGGFAITAIALACDAVVPGIADAQFHDLAEKAKTGCPISKALAAVPTITLSAQLKKAAA